jgi:hypothetical protein
VTSGARLPPIVVIGHPRHLRVVLFVRAAEAAGLDTPRVLAHADLIARPERLREELGDQMQLVRIESVGQNETVARRLLALGEEDAQADGRCSVASAGSLAADPPSRFELRAPRQMHYGFQRYLRALDAVAAPAWTFLTRPAAIEVLFDKNECARRLGAIGIPVPRAIDGARSADELVERMEREAIERVYVKLPYASSASGLAVLRRSSRGRVTAWSTLARREGRCFSSRRIQRYQRASDVRAAIDFLLAEGARVEVGLPKARVGGRLSDLRVLVIARQPAFVVVRTSAHPLTNLHLGGQPADADVFRDRVPEARWQRMLDDCVAAADDLDTFHLGLDVVFDPSLGAHTVIEANAFGDLLPRERREGQDTYGWQIRALLGAAGELEEAAAARVVRRGGRVASRVR